ncbi:MAG: efflux RND transporter periplasmic adaptor subunit [Planctomycetota bacterium]|jgi:RND family efflux transporter MFP subunit
MRSFALLALLFASTAACGGGKPQGAAGGPSRPPRPVQLVAVGTAQLPRHLAATGALAAQEELVLGLEVGGRLATLGVDVGDRVEPGAVLAALDDRDLQLASQRASAAVAAAEARIGVPSGASLERFDVEQTPAVREAKAVLIEAGLNRDRVATMVEQNMQSGRELDAAEATRAVAESRLQRARDDVRTQIADAALRRVEVAQAEKRLVDSRVVAPWAGRVAARHVTAGQVVAAGAPVVTLLRTEPLRLQLRVPDRAAAEVAVGQVVRFTVDGPAAVMEREGRVVRIGPSIERGDRTQLVEAEVGNADGALVVGAFCRARIVTAPAQPVLAVDQRSVVSFAGVDRVFVVEPRSKTDPTPVAKGRIVELGRTIAGKAGPEQFEVLRGIAAGDRIVADATGLAPETPVQVGN